MGISVAGPAARPKSLREIMKEKESNELRLTSGKWCDMRVIFLYRRLWLLKYLDGSGYPLWSPPPHLSQIGRLL